MKRLALIGSLCLAGVALTITGCDSQSTDDQTPPALLPPEVFQIETDLFAPSGNKALAKLNFANAALRVWPVSVILQANLLIPAAVTAAALEDTPEFVDDAWEWASTRQVGEQALTFTLRGMPVDDGIRWTMVVSSDEPLQGHDFDEFELYSAHTQPGGVAGTWQLYYPIDGERRNVLNAEYTFSGEDDREILFGVPVTAAEHGGDSVLYAVDGATHRFLWQQVGEEIDHDVLWNSSTGIGSITATNYNGGAEACWDASYEDAACD